MGVLVCGGASLMCSFGTAPSALTVLPVGRPLLGTMPAATIMDFAPAVNILPFAMCDTVSNPAVASATSAAMGVLTPCPCVPATAAPWIPGVPTVLIGTFPAVDMNCKLMCSYGGVISVVYPGQVQIMS